MQNQRTLPFAKPWLYVASLGWHIHLQSPCPVCGSCTGAPQKMLLRCWPAAAERPQPGCLSLLPWFLLHGRGCFQGMWVQIAPWVLVWVVPQFPCLVGVCCVRKPLFPCPDEQAHFCVVLGLCVKTVLPKLFSSCAFII